VIPTAWQDRALAIELGFRDALPAGDGGYRAVYPGEERHQRLPDWELDARTLRWVVTAGFRVELIPDKNDPAISFCCVKRNPNEASYWAKAASPMDAILSAILLRRERQGG
jgi:hypothetical protein